ncbi:DUF4124 domain-containing protein [Oxalobacteraceae bacterium]|nr:DUF4124 domain-containing protein [Oxalobacteraceae bacterium]
MTTRITRSTGALPRRLSLLGLLGLLAASAAHADGQIFLCLDASGRKELTDANKGPHCRPLDVPGAISTPPPAARKQAGPPRAAPAVSTPADFPRVDNAEQRARDNDRRAILADELKSEQQKLGELRKEFNNGEPERRGDERNYAKYQERVAQLKDSIGRSEKNVEALKREIANIR